MSLLQKGISKPKGKGAIRPTRPGVHETKLQKAKRYGIGQLQAAGLAGIRTLEMAAGIRLDPAPAYLFYIELEGILVALFTECSGLKVKRDVETIEEGGVNYFEHKLPGRIKFDNIVLKRGLSLSQKLWDWFMEGEYDFNVKRLNFSIIQGAPGHNLITALSGAFGLTSAGGYASGGLGTAQEYAFSFLGKGFGKIKHWDIVDAFPVSWQISDLNTSSDKVAIETIEIAHHGLSLSWERGTPMSPAGMVVTTAVSGIMEGIGAALEPSEPAEPCTAVTSVTITGPDALQANETGSFTALFSPLDATSPTFTWTIQDSSGTTVHTEESSRANFSYTFEPDTSATATYTVKVAAENACTSPAKEDSMEVTLTSKPVTSVTVTGPSALEERRIGSFTATAAPDDVSLPITFEWNFGDGVTESIESDSREATIQHAYKPDTLPKSYNITVKATNACTTTAVSSTAFSVNVVDTGQAVTAVTLSGPTTPLTTGTEGTFTAAITPTNATAPIDYEWSEDGLVSGQGTDSAVYKWDEADTYTVQVSAKNSWGEASATQEVNVGTAVTEVTLGGPDELAVDRRGVFTAAVNADATAPIDYEWSEDGLVSPQGRDTARYRWNTAGTYTVEVSADNEWGSDTDSKTVTVS